MHKIDLNSEKGEGMLQNFRYVRNKEKGHVKRTLQSEVVVGIRRLGKHFPKKKA